MKRLQIVCAAAALLALIGCSGRDTVAIDPAEATYEEVERAAAGSTVAFYMWGGSETINRWIDGYVANEMRDRFDIAVERVPMDASVFVQKLLTEKEENKDPGVIDLLWINGENFRNAREAGLLYGPVVPHLPNYEAYVDESSAASDAGYPTDGYEAPYGRAQFNYDYDSARVSDPPRSFEELREWVIENPGRFTYPQPPDFTGSAFIRQAFYAVTGGHEQYQSGFDADLFAERAPALWDYLNALEPYLWQEGTSYPRDVAALDTLFERGEVDFTMSFTQTNATNRIAAGRYPLSVRSLVFTDGSLFNTHFVAVPFNAPNRAGAIVLANFLLSPEAQLSKNDPMNWGDFTVLDMAQLPEDYRERFAALDLGDATAPLEDFSRYGVPEIDTRYWEALEEGWDRSVRGD